MRVVQHSMGSCLLSHSAENWRRRVQGMWQTYRATAPKLPTGPVLLASPTTATATAAAAGALSTLTPSPSPSPRPTPKPTPRPTPKPTPALKTTSRPTFRPTAKPTLKPTLSPQTSVTELALYAQCGGIAGSPVCSPHCTDVAWSTARCMNGTCQRSSGWYWQCLP